MMSCRLSDLIYFCTLCVCLTRAGKRQAKAVLYSNTQEISGLISSTLMGFVEFSQESPTSELEIKISLLQNSNVKDGKHGFHIHKLGNIWGGCISSGGHYNPMDVGHGGPSAGIRHVGDLGNIDIKGNAFTGTITDTKASLFGKYSIIGRAVVLHAEQDDLGKGTGDVAAGSKKTGNAGARLACGVIGINSNGYDNGGFRSTSTAFVIGLMLLIQYVVF